MSNQKIAMRDEPIKKSKEAQFKGGRRKKLKIGKNITPIFSKIAKKKGYKFLCKKLFERNMGLAHSSPPAPLLHMSVTDFSNKKAYES